tara:strand:+ start:10316 stop:10759 length:444 start_codon:yes stop_codon:yes gene_type:complete
MMNRNQYTKLRGVYKHLLVCLDEMCMPRQLLADCVRYCKKHETNDDHRLAKLLVVREVLDGILTCWKSPIDNGKQTAEVLCLETQGIQLAYLLGYRIATHYEPMVVNYGSYRLCPKDKNHSFFVDHCLFTVNTYYNDSTQLQERVSK